MPPMGYTYNNNNIRRHSREIYTLKRFEFWQMGTSILGNVHSDRYIM